MSSCIIGFKSSRISLFSSAKRHSIIPQWSTRNAHIRRPLPYPIEDGLGAFLPPPALKMLAVDFQDGLLERLNDETRGTNGFKSVAQTVIDTASDTAKALEFNYASEALNNSFFLDCLKPPPPPPAANHEDGISPNLGTVIRTNEGSLAELKSKFSATTLGMSSSGYVWFVTDQTGNTGVLPTYGPGTLLVRSRQQNTPLAGLVLGESKIRRGSVDKGRPDPGAVSEFGPSTTSPTSKPRGSSRALHTSPSSSLDSPLSATPASVYSNPADNPGAYHAGARFDLTTLGETLYPLFCISVHERAWISAGYGVWGKEKWVAEFWKVLDWNKVSEAYVKWVSDKKKT